MTIGYMAALAGGTLALLSPCGAVLLPGFFAYAFGSGTRLVGRTLLFYVGLAAVLVPLGMGSALLSGLVYRHQEVLTTVAGALLIGFGLLVLAGGGFSLPGTEWLRGRVRGDSPVAVVALGAVSGVAGFCAGPILGSVLTIAAASGAGSSGTAAALRGGTLLAVYALGMVVPLLLLAALWDRFDLGRKGWLRGRGLRVGRLRVHTTSAASAAIFVGVGVLFVLTDGTQRLTGRVDVLRRVEAAAESWLLRAQAYVPDLLVVAVAAAVLGMVAWRVLRRSGANPSGGSDPSAGSTPSRDSATGPGGG